MERIQRIMLVSPRSESVREAEKIGFVNGVHHLDRGALDDLVFQRRHSERPLPPISLWDVHPANRLRPVRSSLQPAREVLEISLQSLAIVLPRLPVRTRRSFPLEFEVGRPECLKVVHVVQKRREPQLPVLFRCLTYPLQRTVRVFPARCPGRVLLLQVSFGRTPSLRPLRDRHGLPGSVRGLRRYYGSVRLPVSVRHRRASLDFPMRSEATAASDGRGISRFPCEVLPYVHGVSDRAGPRCTLRYRCTECCLPPAPRASASRSMPLSRLITQPARSPVNASATPLRTSPHDSEPVWIASPSPYDSFIHYTSPVFPAHRS